LRKVAKKQTEPLMDVENLYSLAKSVKINVRFLDSCVRKNKPLSNGSVVAHLCHHPKSLNFQVKNTRGRELLPATLQKALARFLL